MPKRNSTTPKPTKGVLRTFSLGFGLLSLALALGGAVSLANKPATSVAAEPNSWAPNPYEEEVAYKELAVTAVSSTLTSTTQSLSVSFRSKKIEAWANGARYKNVYILPDDPEWTVEKALADYEAAKEEFGPDAEFPHYPASVYNISYNRNAAGDKSSIVIPSVVTNNKGFAFDVTGILGDCCFDPETGLVSYANISEIVIPDTVKTIAPGAFYDVPETVSIYCQAPEYTEDEEGNESLTYPEEWTDAPVTFGHELTDEQQRKLNLATPTSEPFGEGADFFLGIKTEEYDLPMMLEYRYERFVEGNWIPEDGVHWLEVPIQATNRPYDGVGTQMGQTDLTFNISIPVDEKLRVHSDSVTFHNIFRAVSTPSGMVPDIQEGEEWNGEYCASPAIAYSVVPHFTDFFVLRPLSYSTLGGYLQLEVEFARNPGTTGYGFYPILEPTLFAQNRAALDAGTLSVRYQFAALDQASYRFGMKDGSYIEHRVTTPVKYVLLSGEVNKTGFLINLADFPGLKTEEIASVELANFTIKSDLFNNTTHAIVTKSSISLRFASLALLSDFSAVGHIDVAMILVISYIAYVVVFAAIAIGYYLYAKRHYRNDEFRRVNNKRYLINTIKNFIGFAAIFSAILFIFCRWGLLRTTVVTFNPLDAFVAAFTVVGAIFLGFTIKNVVVSFKNARKRKEAIRLKLDQDVADDGTK